MPTLVKEAHIEALRTKMVGMKGTAAEVATALNAPLPTGATEPVVRDVSAQDAARALVVAAGDVQKFDTEVAKETVDQVPIMGASWGRTAGIGEILPEFVMQIRDTVQEVRV